MTLIHKLIERLNLTPKSVYEMNMIEACNWLSYFKEFDEYKQKLEDKAKGVNRL